VVIWVITTLLSFQTGVPARAQATGDAAGPSTDTDVEQLYDKFQKDDADRKARENTQRRQSEKAKPDLTTLSDLGTLEPFDDIAVIERRYLPKTNRFEINLNGLVGLNNPFFSNLGAAARLAYYFQERYGLELMYFYLNSSARQITTNLHDNRDIATTSFVSAESFAGAAFRWNPIYGKITFLNNRIVPFDMTFSLGGGVTGTNAGREEPTVHIGTSQVYALSKSWALRWDLNWNFYQAHSTLTNGTSSTGFQNDLMLGLGASFFFPEAKYR
jgi:outer membrane beta-barrel protein